MRTQVSVAGSDAVTDLVRENIDDVGLTFNPTSLARLGVAHVQDLPVGAVVSPGHALARQSTVSLRDCLQHPLAWPARGLSLRTLLDTIVRRQKLNIKPAVECNSLRVMAGLARRGVCIAFQTTIGIEQDLDDGTLRFIPLGDRPLPPDRMMLVHRPGLTSESAAAAFLNHATGLLPRMVPVPRKRTRRAE